MVNLKKILVVDDDLFTIKVIKIMLGNDFNLTLCNDGLEALKHIQNTSYSAVITDLNMPNENGLHLAQKIKKLSQNTPILMISSEVFKNAKDYDLLNQICNYTDETLGKPFTKNQLIVSLNSIL